MDEQGEELELGELFGFTTGDWPTLGAVYEAPSGRAYLEVDGSRLGADVRASTQPLLDAFETAGSLRVGDLVCDVSPNILIRGLAGADHYAVLIVPPYVDVVIDVYSSFDDGSSLTTTTNPLGGLGGAERGIYRRSVPRTISVEHLLAVHRAELDEHRAARGVEVGEVRADLVGLAASFEEFLARQST